MLNSRADFRKLVMGFINGSWFPAIFWQASLLNCAILWQMHPFKPVVNQMDLECIDNLHG